MDNDKTCPICGQDDCNQDSCPHKEWESWDHDDLDED